MDPYENIPSSIYRVQFGKDLSLQKAANLIPYLKDLGIEGFYGSPLFASCDDSGYHVIDHNRLNPTLGSLEDFESFCSLLKKEKLFHILDLVPNHMGLKDNAYLFDILKKGKSSPFSFFFSIDFDEKERMILPILEAPLRSLIKKGVISLVYEEEPLIKYGNYRFPLKGPVKEGQDLLSLLREQHYRLVYWKVAGLVVNYRRFFQIGELVATRMETPAAFYWHHAFALELIRDGKVQGLRVDHPDGLADPVNYLSLLQKEKSLLVVVEKILSEGECFPKNWKISGGVGYEFLSVLNGIFIKTESEGVLTSCYERFVEKPVSFKELLLTAKKKYIHIQMGSEISLLLSLLGKEKDYAFRKVLQEFMAHLPVYRTYIEENLPVNHETKKVVEQALGKTDSKEKEELKNILLEKRNFSFIQRLQQVTAAVSAKGLEDAVFYQYNRLIALNEVGSSPEFFGKSIEEFHAFNKTKLQKHPFGFLTSSTHDSKFSEDVRFRLGSLSCIPKEWEKAVFSWKEQNKKYKTEIKGQLFPDLNTEYFIYQVLLGAWEEPLSSRLLDALLFTFFKAGREAGVFTSWRLPNEDFEKAVKEFVQKILTPKEENLFYPSFLALQKKVKALGEKNSLAALTLKIGSCGVVDIYQGNETARFCLVDPDNRRPIDYESKDKDSFAKLKRLITKKGLSFRKKHKSLFLQGDYTPLKAMGDHSDSVIAFIREEKNMAALIIGVRTENMESSLENTYLELPKSLQESSLYAVFSEKRFSSKEHIYLKDLLLPFSFGVFSIEKSEK